MKVGKRFHWSIGTDVKSDTQGTSVLDKRPIRRRSSLEHTRFEGSWVFRSPLGTAGLPSNTEPMRTSTGSAPFVTGIARLLPGLYKSVEERFQQLSDEWKRDTGHLSTISRIVAHPSYLGIVAIGKPAIALILKDLQTEPNHRFSALYSIAGEGPHIPAHDRGDMRKISKAWLEWGKGKRYIE